MSTTRKNNNSSNNKDFADAMQHRRDGRFRTPLAQTVTLGGVFFFVFASYVHDDSILCSYNLRTAISRRFCGSRLRDVYTGVSRGSECYQSMGKSDRSPRRRIGIRLSRSSLVGACHLRNGMDCCILRWSFGYRGSPPVDGTGATHFGVCRRGTGTIRSTHIMGIFWAVFQCSALVGGILSFCFYNI